MMSASGCVGATWAAAPLDLSGAGMTIATGAAGVGTATSNKLDVVSAAATNAPPSSSC
jgi:hypothetical protein